MVSGVQFSNQSALDRLKIGLFSISFIFESNLNLLALKLEDAGKIDLLDRSGSILIAFIIQIIYFGDIPGLYTCLGAGLVLLAVVVLGIRVISRQNNNNNNNNNNNSNNNNNNNK